MTATGSRSNFVVSFNVSLQKPQDKWKSELWLDYGFVSLDQTLYDLFLQWTPKEEEGWYFHISLVDTRLLPHQYNGGRRQYCPMWLFVRYCEWPWAVSVIAAIGQIIFVSRCILDYSLYVHAYLSFGRGRCQPDYVRWTKVTSQSTSTKPRQ